MSPGEARGLLHYYVYYRVRPGVDLDDAQASVRAMQSALAARTGVAGRLMERLGDATTWMEIYEPVADPVAFEAALESEAAAFRLAELIEPGSARHVERFEECV